MDSATIREHRNLMERANFRGLTYHGMPARVAGACLAYAQVYVEDNEQSRWLLVGQYDWRVIENAITGEGAVL